MSAKGPATARERRLRAAAFVLLVPLLLTVGCSKGEHAATASNGSGVTDSKNDKGKQTPPASAARITVTPADGTRSVEPDDKVEVRAEDGTLAKVTVEDEDGKELDGTWNEEKTSWRADDILSPSSTYTVTASATDKDGREAKTKATFRTVVARKLVRTSVVPLNGETVGVGQPIAVKFNTTIKRDFRAAVQRRLVVTTSPSVTGSWHWIDGQNLHYRPQHYWRPGTKVRLRIGLTGLKAGDRVYGGESRTIRFTIGRSMVSVVNIARHTMTVAQNGKVVRTIPISTGKKGFETRGGIKVVLEKTQHKVMDAATVGIAKDSPEYYHLDVFYAVRVTWSGEFVHAAPWSVGSQGRANVSHGCVGMSTANAQWFFANAVRGDIVQVVGNPRKPMELQNGFGDWNLPWSTWKAGSAD